MHKALELIVGCGALVTAVACTSDDSSGSTGAGGPNAGTVGTGMGGATATATAAQSSSTVAGSGVNGPGTTSTVAAVSSGGAAGTTQGPTSSTGAGAPGTGGGSSSGGAATGTGGSSGGTTSTTEIASCTLRAEWDETLLSSCTEVEGPDAADFYEDSCDHTSTALVAEFNPTEPCARDSALGQCEQAMEDGLVLRTIIYNDDETFLAQAENSCNNNGYTWTDL